jgi:hypothetical protein
MRIPLPLTFKEKGTGISAFFIAGTELEPETAKICEKLLLLPSFRVCGSNVPEEQLFTEVGINKTANRLQSFGMKSNRFQKYAMFF